MPVSPEDLLAALRWRYATKRFDPARIIPPTTWDALEESLVLTPSSFGLQPWRFVVVRDPALRANLSEESWKQSQVTDASHFIVLTARTDLTSSDVDTWMDRMAEIQQTPPETVAVIRGMIQGFAESMSHDERRSWNMHQAYIALGQLMASAAVMEIDTCPMEGLSRTGYDQVLGLGGSGYTTVVACALGYRLPDDRAATTAKARFERSHVITHR